MALRHLLQKIANRLSWKNFHKTLSPPLGSTIRSSIKETYLLIKGLGFFPKTVIDVGVAGGTFELYKSFPDSYFLLVEPLNEYEPNLKSMLKKFRGSYVLAAAGANTGEVDFYLHDHYLEGSSLYQETMGKEADGHRIAVPMIKIDDVIMERSLEGPYLIKVDVQGGELEVLEGCQNALRDTEVIVLEVSLFEFMKGAPQFSEVIFYMKQHGFVTYDIIQGWNRPLDNALGQVDIVFVKENGRFRQSHSFASLEQLKENPQS